MTAREHLGWPRITLVTAVYNGEAHLEATIQSVLQQRYPDLEYILVNDGSTDGTRDVITRYEQHIASVIDQTNQGLYAALNAGFARSTGEIMGWLNSGDLLHTNGLFVVGSVFSSFQHVEWITGRPTVFDSRGMPIQIQELPRWSRYRFLAGANRHIQQESTYWRKNLWERAGNALSVTYRAEGDFEQWIRFFRHTRLYSVNALIGGYRMHENSLSHTNINQYNERCDEIVESELESIRGGKWIRLFRSIGARATRVPKARWAWRQFMVATLYRWPGPDWAPSIEYHVDEGRWILRR
ncbi:MAG TPA: glycosyltransferase family 2 protein [Candidatus Acidoferrum sp.]|nr:glycosyltransferase family 2 protein [Candidatus Acidoferrum sp.]